MRGSELLQWPWYAAQLLTSLMLLLISPQTLSWARMDRPARLPVTGCVLTLTFRPHDDLSSVITKINLFGKRDLKWKRNSAVSDVGLLGKMMTSADSIPADMPWGVCPCSLGRITVGGTFVRQESDCPQRRLGAGPHVRCFTACLSLWNLEDVKQEAEPGMTVSAT